MSSSSSDSDEDDFEFDPVVQSLGAAVDHAHEAVQRMRQAGRAEALGAHLAEVENLERDVMVAGRRYVAMLEAVRDGRVTARKPAAAECPAATAAAAAVAQPPAPTTHAPLVKKLLEATRLEILARASKTSQHGLWKDVGVRIGSNNTSTRMRLAFEGALKWPPNSASQDDPASWERLKAWAAA